MRNFSLGPEIMMYLKGILFPVTTDELADYAKDSGAPEEILAQLRFAPDHIFNSFDDINLTYGLLEEFQSADNLWASPRDDDLLAPEEAAITVKDTDTDSEGLSP